eukprot:scaffold662_cov364-Pavlova_lutheri.AAC.44
MGPSTVPTLERDEAGVVRDWDGGGGGGGVDRSSPSFPPPHPKCPFVVGVGFKAGVAILGGRGQEKVGWGGSRMGSSRWWVSDPSPSSILHPPSSILHPLGRGPFTTHVVRQPTHVAPLRAPHLPRASERGWWEVAGRGGEPGKERGGYTQPQPYTHVNQDLAAEPHLSSGRPEAVVETETKTWNTPGGSVEVRTKPKGRTRSPARR